MKKKLELSELKVKSFVTLENKAALLAGGAPGEEYLASDDTWDLLGCRTTEEPGSICGPGTGGQTDHC